jgi:RNA polymerase sigma factor (sigma-70 family)
MSNEELAQCIQQGERDKLPELWEQVNRFVSMTAGKCIRSLGDRASVTVDDLINSGYIAMVAAAETYNPEQGMKFIGWLAFHLKSAFAEAGAYRSKRQRLDPIHSATSLDLPIGENEDGGTLSDLVADPCDPYEEAERRVFLEQLHGEMVTALDALPELERGVIERRYYGGDTLTALGDEMGVSFQRVRQLETSGLRKLRHPRITRRLSPFIESRTNYFFHVGVDRFNTTGTSAVEEIAMQRERMRAKNC